ncbi:Transglutaminase-like superfamily protein [Eubacterium ruminantium]|nr:Transglutaminase-like superfamily protein [Eubacterium ruminantium]
MKRNHKNKGSISNTLFTFFIILIIVSAIVFLGYKVYGVYKKAADDKKLETASTLEQAADIIKSILDNKKQNEVVMYVTEDLADQLADINQYLTTTAGFVESYELIKNDYSKIKARFKIIKNATTYVYDCFKNGTEIPKNKKDALQLYDKVKNIVSQITSPGMTDYQKELILHDYLVSHCTYSLGSIENENEFRAYGALIDGEAVCSGYSEAMSLLLTCAGIENEIVIGNAGGEGHAWNMVKLDNKWYHLDATWDDPKGMDVVSHTYFNLSDAEIKTTHSWLINYANKADSDDMSYFSNTGYIASDKASFINAAVNEYYSTNGRNYFEIAITGYDTDDYMTGLIDHLGVSSLSYSKKEMRNYTVLLIYK